MADEVDVDDEQVLEKDPQYPIKVIYCGECGLPYDYCKYSPAFAKCKPWLLKNYPALFEKLYSGDAGVDTVTAQTEQLTVSDTPAAEAPKEAPKKKKGKELPPAQVIITSEQRKGKRSITVVTGLAAFGIKLADAGKAFSKKFACGASPDKTKDEIVIQGDIQDELEEFILEIYADKIKEDQVIVQEAAPAKPTGGKPTGGKPTGKKH